ncbi:MAG: hypothetical protein IJT28_05465, partial [Bacteroidaceae bacterium]|nr:hypothetical protein [Bacteroidaceae bacterium]
AGSTDHRPLSAAISIEGISGDHTDAATITPDAKPSNVFCNRTDISPRIKNTKAEPSIVPSSGINSPIINVVVIYHLGLIISEFQWRHAEVVLDVLAEE